MNQIVTAQKSGGAGAFVFVMLLCAGGFVALILGFAWIAPAVGLGPPEGHIVARNGRVTEDLKLTDCQVRGIMKPLVWRRLTDPVTVTVTRQVTYGATTESAERIEGTTLSFSGYDPQTEVEVRADVETTDSGLMDDVKVSKPRPEDPRYLARFGDTSFWTQVAHSRLARVTFGPVMPHPYASLPAIVVRCQIDDWHRERLRRLVYSKLWESK